MILLFLVLFCNKEIKDLIQYCADLGLGIHT